MPCAKWRAIPRWVNEALLAALPQKLSAPATNHQRAELVRFRASAVVGSSHKILFRAEALWDFLNQLNKKIPSA